MHAYKLHGAESWKIQLDKKFPAFMKHIGSLLCSQDPAKSLSWTRWIQATISYPTFSQIHSYIILPSGPGYSNQNFVCISHRILYENIRLLCKNNAILIRNS